MGALYAVEEIQKNRLLSEVTKIGAFFAPNLGNWSEILGSWEDRSFMRSSPMQNEWQRERKNEVIVYFDRSCSALILISEVPTKPTNSHGAYVYFYNEKKAASRAEIARN